MRVKIDSAKTSLPLQLVDMLGQSWNIKAVIGILHIANRPNLFNCWLKHGRDTMATLHAKPGNNYPYLVSVVILVLAKHFDIGRHAVPHYLARQTVSRQ